MYTAGSDAALSTLGIKSAEVLGRVYSQSKKGKRYTVRKDGDSYSCTCPDYKYRHAARGTHCKHIAARVGGEKTAAQEKVAVGLRQSTRIADALKRMASAGAGPVGEIANAQRIASGGYGTAWRELADSYAATGKTPTLSDTRRIFDMEKGLLGGADRLDEVYMRPEARQFVRQASGEAASMHSQFRPDPSSSVPHDVQRGQFLENNPLKRYTYQPDAIAKIRSQISPKARPIPPPTDGSWDRPEEWAWRGAPSSDLTPGTPRNSPTWVTGHFGVADLHGSASSGGRIRAHDMRDVTTGGYTDHVAKDTRGWTPAQRAATYAASPERRYFERVVDRGDITRQNLLGEFVTTPRGLYPRRPTPFTESLMSGGADAVKLPPK